MRSYLALLAVLPAIRAQTRSAKRGLVYVPNSKTPQDDKIWVQSGSDLTWYYNYAPTPSGAYGDQAQSKFEFVPMLFGAIDDTSFLDAVTGLIDGGRGISHVLTFNEPDGPTQYGGSDIDPARAAQVWVDNIEPLAARGVKVGLPACTGGDGGIPWLQQFLGNCSQLLTKGGVQKNCTYDFVALHWYGNFEGLASHMGQYLATFPNKTQWITEYNYDNQDLTTTQSFFNTSAEYFDPLDSVARYSYFGSFRSRVSNVGANAVMLNNDGKLTDIGSWYLGGVATGVNPQSGLAAPRSQASGMLLAVTLGVVIGSFLV